MTRDFERFISSLVYAAFGKKQDALENAYLKGVLTLALKQGVLPMVYGSLDSEQKKTLNPKWEQMFFRAAMKNEQKLLLSGFLYKVKNMQVVQPRH